MKPTTDFVRIVGGRRYSVRTATLVASDLFWGGHDARFHRCNTWLYRTPRGAFFAVRRTQGQGEQDTLTPVSREEALELYQGTLSVHELPYEEVFPDAGVEDA